MPPTAPLSKKVLHNHKPLVNDTDFLRNGALLANGSVKAGGFLNYRCLEYPGKWLCSI
jgi:hypothetical protein